ncbi:hypothetical protein CRG98_017790 [Punica granatum]|uniref:Retrotransposon Copia-like N-terminal domain-containing protein n=1 Tax=Punica granatum TaxID=22663 RepID=A0A2I0K164_PUNGR|nr:hypothetical protein CRG98_017790 [Punica granatum]
MSDINDPDKSPKKGVERGQSSMMKEDLPPVYPLGNSDETVVALLSCTLKGDNYLNWSRAMLTTLEAKVSNHRHKSTMFIRWSPMRKARRLSHDQRKGYLRQLFFWRRGRIMGRATRAGREILLVCRMVDRVGKEVIRVCRTWAGRATIVLVARPNSSTPQKVGPFANITIRSLQGYPTDYLKKPNGGAGRGST